MIECDMSIPVANWMRERDYVVYSEVPLGMCSARVIDLVGLRGEDLLLVELKVSAVKQVFRQVYLCHLFSNQVYACIAGKPRKSTIEKFQKHGIGLLSLHTGKCTEIVKPTEEIKVIAEIMVSYKDEMIERLKHMEPCDIAGKPNEKGCGPAQDCAKRVREYIKLNPQTSWKLIYKNVPNHYCNSNSLRNAMSCWFGIKITISPIPQLFLHHQ